ncbi:hypothetical protein [Vreelandella titanicae]|uniref:Uncharacterized protein n=1 Tax=Vreelandella titanicae TaxID=664683 RepID=A0AAP9T0D7_9GAMM|nr:hypothetical protein [Halomonas titanicae]QKS24619.1 hypothetical protein FX987_02401 [Halomonas titanicae]
MKASDINYYELTYEEIQDYKDEIFRIRTLSEIISQDDIDKLSTFIAIFSMKTFTNYINENEGLRFGSMLDRGGDIITVSEDSVFTNDFLNTVDFDTSTDFIIHLAMLFSPTYLFAFDNRYHTADKILYLYKHYSPAFLANLDYFKIREELFEDKNFQKELNKMKLLNQDGRKK